MPPSGILYYKYKSPDTAAPEVEEAVKSRTIANRNI